MSNEELATALAAKARTTAESARWSTVQCRLEDNVDDATVFAKAAGVYAERARLMFEAARNLCPCGPAARDALDAAKEAAGAYLAARVAVAVIGARAGKVVKVTFG